MSIPTSTANWITKLDGFGLLWKNIAGRLKLKGVERGHENK